MSPIARQDGQRRIDPELRQRRLDLLDEHFASEVDQGFERTIATFAGHPRYEIVPTGQVHDGELITNERVYLDLVRLLTQIGRGDLLEFLATQA